MSRENRRVAAISWSSTDSAGNGQDLPPAKPSRVPATYVGIGGSAGKSAPSASSEQSLSGPTTEVLAQLIRDNETRADAGHYTSPASAFNRFTVEFSYTSSSNSNPASPQHKCKKKGRKNQPVYVNIMMADATPPSAEIAAAAVATNPAPYKDKPNEPSCEHMEQERRMLDRERRLSVAASSSDRSDTDSMDGANAYKKDRSTPLQGNQLDDQSVVVKNLEP
ncbi:hypothetical protein DAPPUDRAFT_263344 [Daphnia pulex]|uniref:Uncharacterized protein n=1 Tax=Daphnia pulex TaxID=6669 RepID=E9HPJ6_DAPPU|nr:hypothetical protein DAPPUDRAFT_263344 [Daphnia pulex]|eukprot:EFX66334.1 hypothetical protein DAPPUDRAFT_263344 [Daphnia pulex]